MIQQDHGKSLAIAAMLLAIGTFGGFGLANYAVGGETTAPIASWAPEDNQPDQSSFVTSVAMADGPNDYICRGCGPTLADRRMQRDLADAGYSAESYPEIYETMPAYRSTSIEDINEPAMVDPSAY